MRSKFLNNSQWSRWLNQLYHILDESLVLVNAEKIPRVVRFFHLTFFIVAFSSDEHHTFCWWLLLNVRIIKIRPHYASFQQVIH